MDRVKYVAEGCQEPHKCRGKRSLAFNISSFNVRCFDFIPRVIVYWLLGHLSDLCFILYAQSKIGRLLLFFCGQLSVKTAAHFKHSRKLAGVGRSFWRLEEPQTHQRGCPRSQAYLSQAANTYYQNGLIIDPLSAWHQPPKSYTGDSQLASVNQGKLGKQASPSSSRLVQGCEDGLHCHEWAHVEAQKATNCPARMQIRCLTRMRHGTS